MRDPDTRPFRRRTAPFAPALAGALLFVLALLASCATIPDDDLAWTTDARASRAARCAHQPQAVDRHAGEIDPRSPILVVSWNVHKNARAGWDQDLTRFLAASELVLLQEALLEPAMRSTLERLGTHWVLAEAWSSARGATGAMIASRAAPMRSCVLREVEPAGIPPKSAVVAWFRLAGRSDHLAVASVHSVNFSPGLAAYRRQLEALAAVLSPHRGPIVVGGDFNTWSPVREAALVEILGGLGLVAVVPSRDARSRFLGLPADHLYVRGLVAIESGVAWVASSDHAPIVAALALEPR